MTSTDPVGHAWRVLRSTSPVRALSETDRDEALALCARNPAANAFVAGRIEEGALRTQPGALLGYREDGDLRGIVWASANLVPAECDQNAIDAIAQKVRRWRRQCASIFGPREQVGGLWTHLRSGWGPPRAVRGDQPLMQTSTRPSALGLPIDPRVRRATADEVDLVLPAAAAMFTDEIGYPPFLGSAGGYRSMLSGLIARGHTWVWVEGREVLFKADVGSVGLDTAQVQGVWLAPRLRGQGLSVPLMAAVTESIMESVAGTASLYVNDFNQPARATYRSIGYEEVGTFSTILF